MIQDDILKDLLKEELHIDQWKAIVSLRTHPGYDALCSLLNKRVLTSFNQLFDMVEGEEFAYRRHRVAALRTIITMMKDIPIKAERQLTKIEAKKVS